MRSLLIVLCAVGLSACNMVYSEKPLFTAADSARGPKLKPGVWVSPKPDCAFEPAQTPLPDCADAVLIDATHFRAAPGAKAPSPGGPEDLAYVLAAGAPPVMQLKLEMKDGGKAALWFYAGVKALKTDRRGRIVEMRAWPVQCGPPPPKGSNKHGTTAPLAGLAMDKDGNCTPKDAAAVFSAAKASEAWQDEPGDAARWLRDSKP